MTNVPDAFRSFLDIEAQVGNEEDDEEYEDEPGPDDFIDDQDYGRPKDAPTPLTLQNQLPDRHERVVNNVLAGIMERSRARQSRYDGDLDSDDDLDTPAAEIARQPTDADYPLLRVRCVQGMERDAVFYLGSAAEPRHMLRSAFTRDSVRGWIYIEAFMNRALSELLHSKPHLIRPQQGLWGIPKDEWTMILDMDSGEKYPSVGDWVTVRRGLYKGDVGYVSSVDNSGEITLLLIPRPPLPPCDSSSAKRKRPGARADPVLFDIETLTRLASSHGTQYKTEHHETKTVFMLFGRIFEEMLERRTFHLAEISLTASMSSEIQFRFQYVPHPETRQATYPCPSDWKFFEGERVRLWSSESRGIIKAVGKTSVEVDLESGEGTMNFPWKDVRKDVALGDFAEVLSGPFQGHRGWVTGIGEELEVSGCSSRVEINGGPTIRGPGNIGHGGVLHNLLEPRDVHYNHIKLTDPPFMWKPPSSSSTPADPPTLNQVHWTIPKDPRQIGEEARRRWDTLGGLEKADSTHPFAVDPLQRAPWLKTEVIIRKVKHPMKGYRAIVKDVLPLQDTLSGLRIAVQFTHMDPAHPFKTQVLDYDDVVEASSGLQLYNFVRPLSDLFKPLPGHKARDSKPQQTPAGGSRTPMPDYVLSSPAWNPSSRTPVPHSPETGAVSRSHHLPAPPQQQGPAHPLLDSRLIGVKMKVSVTGGEHKNKEMVVAVAQVEGQLSIRFSHYKMSVSLPPEHVSPKYPNPTRDNALLVVIEGDHCGKYVRRIHHRYKDGRTTVMLAVVHRMEDGHESLSEERLELSANELCLGYETKEDRKRGDGLMSGLRKEAQKIRAK